MSYTPPDSKMVGLSFVGAYTAPDSKMVEINLIPPTTGNTQAVYPGTISSYVAGVPNIGNTARALLPAGVATDVFGGATVANSARDIRPDGFSESFSGAPEKVWNYHQFFTAKSINEAPFGAHTVRNQREYLYPSSVGATLFGSPELGHEDRSIHALAPTHAVGNLAAETYSPTCVAGGYGFFAGHSILNSDSSGSEIREYFWARVDYPSLTNPVKIPQVGGRIDPYGRSTVVTDGSYLYTFHVDINGVGLPIPTLSKRDFSYNVITQTTLPESKALGAIFVLGGRLFLHADTPALSIEEIDKATLAPISSCSVSSAEKSTSDGSHIYLIYSNKQVAVFDPTSNSITGTTPTVITPEQNGIITTHRNIVYAIGVQGKIWVCLSERDEDPNATITEWRSFLQVYDQTTLLLEQTLDLAAIPRSPSIATTLYHTGRYVIAAPNGLFGAAWYYVFEASTAKPLGGFPGMNVPEEAFSNPSYVGTTPAEEAASIPFARARASRGTFTIGPSGYGNHNAYEWVFPAAAVFPNETLLLSVVSAVDTKHNVSGTDVFNHVTTPAATIAMRTHVENTWSETFAPNGWGGVVVGTPSIRNQRRYVTPHSTGHTWLGEPQAQLKNRPVSPRAIDSGQFGDVLLRSNVLTALGFDAAEVSLPDVSDRHQDVYPAAVSESAIMGDPPRVWNYTRYIIPDSTDHSRFPNFQPTVDNFNKEAHPVGYAATRWGTSQIANKAVALQMVGLDATLFGNSDTTNWFQYRATTGTDLSLFGTAEVLNAQLVAHPVGADTATIGDAEISLKHRTLLIDGIDPPQPSDDLWVSPSPRIFGRFGGVDASSVSQPDVSHGVRYLLPQPFLPAVFGSLRTGLTVREISPAGIFFQTPAAAFGPPRVADAIQIISAAGTDGATVSSIDIARNEVALAQITLGTQTVLGTTQVELSRRVVRTIGAAHDYFGEPNAWNWRTYVAARPPLISDIFGAVSAELRNKLLHPVGFDTGRVSAYVDASNNARLVAPAGDDLSQFGTSLVADRVRSIVTAGEDTGRVSIWSTTYNMRKIAEPASFSRTRYGVPYIWRNERFVTVGSCGDSEMFGDAMVADRIRTVTQYRYADPMMGFPTVALYTQYVSPQGFAERFGGVTLTHFRNEARIFGSNYMRFGAPEIRNFNPQAWVDGIGAPISTEKPWLSFRVRPIDLSGWAIGDYAPARPVVEFRTRTVLPAGYATDALPRTHDIRFDMPQVAAEQRVLPWGIEKPAPSLPSITSNVLFPDGEDAAKLGRIYIAGNEFAQNSALCDFAKVSDLTISHRDQRIYVNSAAEPLVFKPSAVSLSPITVGPFGDDDPTQLIDFKLVTDSTDAFARPFFGYPTASNYSRAAQVSGRNHLDVGMPEVRTNYLYPEGWDSNEAKFGMTDFAGPQYIEPYWGRLTADYIPEVEEYNFDTALYGEVNTHAYAPPPVWNPYRDITGSNMQLFGMLNIENFNRAVYPDGSEVDRFGFVWLHPPFRLLPGGITPPDITIEQVAFRIREVYPTGDEHAVVCQEEAETIAGRMRVRHGTSRYAVDSITPPPITGTEISHRIRTINTSGVDFGQARIVRISRLRGENTCRPSGADSSVFGTPSKVIEGQITPYAPDMQQLGTVRTARRLYCWGVPPNEPSDIRAGRLVYPNGAGPDIFDGPSITNPYGCRNRVITVSAGDNFSTFGGAHATN